MSAPKAEAIRRALQAGMSLKRAQERSGATMNYVTSVARQLGYRKPHGPPRNSALRQAIVDAYANHTPLAEVAAQQGSTVGSIKVLACRMGLSRRPQKAADLRAARKARVPAHLAADYRIIRRKNFSIAEARAMLGLAP